jgi:hypothetical protein
MMVKSWNGAHRKSWNTPVLEAQVIEIMARVTGLEPATSGVTGRRSNRLSYTRKRSAPHLPFAAAVAVA